MIKFNYLDEILTPNIKEKTVIEGRPRKIEMAFDYARRHRDPIPYPIKLNSDATVP